MSENQKDTNSVGSSPKVPSEFRLSLQWENAFKRLGTNSTIGSVGCGLASLILFSKILTIFLT